MITVAQLVASYWWRLGFLDFTQAFHAGDKIQRTLYCEEKKGKKIGQDRTGQERNGN